MNTIILNAINELSSGWLRPSTERSLREMGNTQISIALSCYNAPEDSVLKIDDQELIERLASIR